MISAIVYESNTGFTKKYAELLSAETSIPCYPLAESKAREGDSIIFMGWLCAGKIKGYNKAAKKYNIRAVAGVGMQSPTAKALSDLIKQNGLGSTPAFYLQGGLNMQKLQGLNKIMFQTAAKVMSGKAKEGDEEAAKMVDMVNNVRDYVSPDNLSGLLDWYKSAV